MVKSLAKKLTTARWFELGITAIIIINSVLIGVETYTADPTIKIIQTIILGIFTFEILMRFIAADSVKAFFTDGWNIFDLTLVLIGYIPETIFANASAMMALRVVRVFRVLRLLRATKEIKVMITVLVKSMSALFYNVVMFCIFVYLFAIVGVGLFRLPDPSTLSGEQLANYEKLMELAPNAPANSPDPYGTLHEATFTLFRALTGEDWTDLRYNLVTASRLGVIKVSPTVITLFHVLWFTLSAFLLLNLVVGAIVNNYQLAIQEAEEEEKKEREEKKRKEREEKKKAKEEALA
ncbi:MAG: ion transporter [Bacteroidales bacterium]|nr:ion transporter [Bacteroidales bacterium]